jgi:hypothetical protein
MIICIFLALFGFYFFLSGVYSIFNLRQNIAFGLRHLEQNLKHRILHKIISITKTIFLSVIFGGLILSQKIYRFFLKRYQEYRAWYSIVKIAKKITNKIIKDVHNDQEKKS